MIKRNQHVIPRCYLKHFKNNEGLVYAYNVIGERFLKTNINHVCSHKDAYETFDKIDNILENDIAMIEENLSPYLDDLIFKALNGNLKREDIDNHKLFKYIMLLQLRTDSNRILFTRALFGYEGMDHHMNIDELKENEIFLRLFNVKFKQKGALNSTLDDWYKKTKPEIRIGITKKDRFITSDNPVVLFYIPNETDYVAIKHVLPICPNVCIYFFGLDKIGISKEKQVNFPYMIENDTVQGYNQVIIKAANFWIVSSNPFNVIQQQGLFQRFKKK